MDDAPTDAQLARHIQARSAPCHAEEAELVRRLGPRVRLYGLRHLRDEAEAEDLVQRVMWTAIRKLRAGEVNEPEKIVSFVLGTARRTAYALRRERQQGAALADVDRELAAAVPPPREPFPRQDLAACLQSLGERARSVVVLTYYQDQDASAISEVTGLSAGNVRVIRHRAMRALRDCLEGARTR